MLLGIGYRRALSECKWRERESLQTIRAMYKITEHSLKRFSLQTPPADSSGISQVKVELIRHEKVAAVKRVPEFFSSDLAAVCELSLTTC